MTTALVILLSLVAVFAAVSALASVLILAAVGRVMAEAEAKDRERLGGRA